MPVGGGVGRLFKVGDQPVSASISGYCNAIYCRCGSDTFTLMLHSAYPAAGQQERTRWLRQSPLIAGPSPSRSLVRRKPATVSASALALHLDCSRTYIGKLEAEGVIQRQGDGFPLDQSRVAYLRYLRRERQQSPRTRGRR